jgi:hypothetical protein
MNSSIGIKFTHTNEPKIPIFSLLLLSSFSSQHPVINGDGRRLSLRELLELERVQQQGVAGR